MNELPHGFAEAYATALRTQFHAQNEAGLMRAYELGRWALNEDVSVLDLALLHHQVMGSIELDPDNPDRQSWLIRAAVFLAESLSPFEMTLLGVRETNDKLVALNSELAAANQEAVSANALLQAESLERRRAEEALWQAQKHQAVGRLAGGVAHHFNNILTVILGNLDMARRSVSDPGLAQKLERAAEASHRAVKLTRQLLTFAGRQMLQPDRLELSERLPDVISLLRGSLRGDIEVRSEIPSGLWPIKVDPSELELALLNLAINAGHAMQGGGVLRIGAANRTVTNDDLDLDGDYLMIEVSDDGPGIPADILSRVFDPFFTTKDVGVGTGLGLSQVHGFAHQSGGAVEIESEPGQGVTIRIYLPALREGAAHAGPSQDKAEVILVVEDDVDVAEIAASILNSHGFSVKLAYRAQVALDLLNQGEHVDLVFSDVVMPGGMDGLDLARELRRNFPAMPVLLASGYSDALGGAENLGVPVISKPYRSGDLFGRVSALLGKHDGDAGPGGPHLSIRGKTEH